MEEPSQSGFRKVLKYVSRGVQAAAFLAVNFAFFFLAPTLIFGFTGQLTPNVETTVSSYFVAIAALTVTRIMLKDHVLGTASAVSLGLLEAIFIYNVTQGGVMTVNVSGFSATLEFKPILYLMMTTPLLGVVKQIYSAAHKSATQPVSMMETVGE